MRILCSRYGFSVRTLFYIVTVPGSSAVAGVVAIRVGKNGRLNIEDDVERYCPDRNVLIETFRQLDVLTREF